MNKAVKYSYKMTVMTAKLVSMRKHYGWLHYLKLFSVGTKLS